jgi:DNA mismatch repair protein MutL
VPVRVDLPPALRSLLQEHHAAFAVWGFGLTMAADGTLQVSAMPTGLRADGVGLALEELGAQLREAGGRPPEDWQEQALTTIACHSAIRVGQPLSQQEMREVLAQLAQCALPRTCPHGWPTLLELSQRALDRHFGGPGEQLPAMDASASVPGAGRR